MKALTRGSEPQKTEHETEQQTNQQRATTAKEFIYGRMGEKEEQLRRQMELRENLRATTGAENLEKDESNNPP